MADPPAAPRARCLCLDIETARHDRLVLREIGVFRPDLDARLRLSGKAPDQPIMQILELPSHPFFMGTQAHPCLTSRPLRPSPMFLGLVAAAMKRRHGQVNLPDCLEAVKRVRVTAEA